MSGRNLPSYLLGTDIQLQTHTGHEDSQGTQNCSGQWVKEGICAVPQMADMHVPTTCDWLLWRMLGSDWFKLGADNFEASLRYFWGHSDAWVMSLLLLLFIQAEDQCGPPLMASQRLCTAGHFLARLWKIYGISQPGITCMTAPWGGLTT